MRFVSWNVNGLRACLTKGFMESFRDMDADVFCLQETKMQEGQAILDLPGYKQFWNSAEKKGYSGTAIFTRVEPIDVTYGIGIAISCLVKSYICPEPRKISSASLSSPSAFKIKKRDFNFN